MALEPFDLISKLAEQNEQIKKLNEQVKALNERIDALQEENTKLILYNNTDDKTSDLIDERKLKLFVTISKSIDEHLSESHTRLTWPPSTPNTNNSNIVLSSSEDEDTLVTSNNTTLKPYPHQPHLITLNSENNGAPSFGNNNNNYNNNNNNSNQYTLFVSWPGSISGEEEIYSLFNSDDIVDIRYVQGKQFAHVDLKSQEALDEAMKLNSVKHPTQEPHFPQFPQFPTSIQFLTPGSYTSVKMGNDMIFNRQKNNNNNYYSTIFISWAGTVSGIEELYGLFNNEDVADIRYVPGKQFAHVDLKTQEALDEALKLNSVS
nr:3082_t:CDS:10 [Entrophospora candida]